MRELIGTVKFFGGLFLLFVAAGMLRDPDPDQFKAGIMVLFGLGFWAGYVCRGYALSKQREEGK